MGRKVAHDVDAKQLDGSSLLPLPHAPDHLYGYARMNWQTNMLQSLPRATLRRMEVNQIILEMIWRALKQKYNFYRNNIVVSLFLII